MFFDGKLFLAQKDTMVKSIQSHQAIKEHKDGCANAFQAQPQFPQAFGLGVWTSPDGEFVLFMVWKWNSLDVDVGYFACYVMVFCF